MEAVASPSPIESACRAGVQADGAVRLTPAQLGDVGAAAALEVVPMPRGLALVLPDVSPRKIYVELTTACDLDCTMCLRRSWGSAGGSMSADTFAALVAQLSDLPSVRTINLSGYGEPTSHSQFYELLCLVKQAGLSAEVVTNGLRLGGEAVERLIDLELDRLVVSVDGIHSSATQRLHAGPFAQVAENLRRLNRRRLARGAACPQVTIEFVATKRNIQELPELAGLARVLGFADILVTNLIPYTPELAEEILYERYSTASRPRRPSPWNPCVDLPPMDARSVAGAAVERLRGAGTHLRTNGADVAGAGPRCRFITEGRLAVRWDGQVSPCLQLLHTHTYYYRDKPKLSRSYHVGNVNETSLPEIWNRPAYRAFRDRVRKFEFSPCIDCGGCDLRETNEEDCTGKAFPRCGECLWAAGLVQCP